MAGTEETRRFYDEKGWQIEGGAPVDRNLFGTKEDGPIRVELHNAHVAAVRAALYGPKPIDALECGCGGTPASQFLDLCASYTGVDFSQAGIDLASKSWESVKVPHQFRQADVCALPFADATFDAVYCAHMIYHIEDPAAQEKALNEMMRVLRPGGVLVLLAANPRPLLFPVRLIKRLLADTPVLGAWLDRLRTKPPLPYQPMSIGWTSRVLAPHGHVDVVTSGLPSTAFHQNVSEYTTFGKLLWRGVRALELKAPRLSAYLGNYITVTCRK